MQEIIIGSLPMLAAFIIALTRYRKLEPSWLRLFPWFMITTFLLQIWGYLYSLPPERKSNHFIFNTYTFIEYGFYFFILYKAIQATRLKRYVAIAGLVFLVIYCYEILITGSFFVYSPFACNAGNFLILVCCMLYLSEILMAERIIYFFRLPMFWIVTGLMFNSIGGFFYLCFFDYIVKNNVDADGQIYGLISTITTVVEYGFFIVGILIKAND
jgi:hypothetical protein